VNLSVNLLDITQRRAAEGERRARREAEVARATAEAASQAKSEFVAALNHELRTPLQAIIGFTELLRTLDLPPDRRQAALEHIDAATEHVLAMADDLLDIAKIEADALPIRVEPVELCGLLDEVLALLAPMAAAHDVILRPPVLASTVPARRGAVRADRRRLRQVLINLITNGVRYNHAGGWVEVGAVHSRTGDSGASTVTVAVRDSGRGIPAEMMSRLFTPFDRLGAECSAEPGAGLGLVVARALTQAMGGTLEIRNAAEAGTTAEITLPA
jgi:signal transduction histidine kinase